MQAFIKLKESLQHHDRNKSEEFRKWLANSGWISEHPVRQLFLYNIRGSYNALEDVIDSSLPLSAAQKRQFLEQNGVLLSPHYSLSDENIARVHSEKYISRMVSLAANREYLDEETPITNDILNAAKNGVNTSIAATRALNESPIALSLVGTPGHHASYSRAYGGFCYYNNASALAFYFASKRKKVSILDLDSHFSNGTASITRRFRKWNLFDLHEQVWASPFSEGQSMGDTDSKYVKNYSLNIGANNPLYLYKFDKCMERLGKDSPDILVVSLGVDSHIEDPFGLLALDDGTFAYIGSKIGEWILSKKGKAIFLTEGGYSQKSPYLIALTLSEANKKLYKK
ncbi:MAG: hypothetical protein QXO70_00670 [Candidatus Pacearchaeota archaeon]